jgi:hypothetical protein
MPDVNSRDRVLAGLPLAGKRVIDLRAQRGDNLRRALNAGAAYVMGIEASARSVDAGRLINAAYGFDAAELRCADIETPGSIDADFDVGLCFADLDLTQTALAAILPRIRELLLLRAAVGEDEWFSRQVRRVRPLLPYWSVLPFNEPEPWRGTTAQGLLVLGREAHPVAVATEGRIEATPLTHAGIRWVEVQRSSRAINLMGSSAPVRGLILDLRQRLTRLAAPDKRELLAVLKPGLPALSLACRDLPPRDVDFGTDRYWLRFLQGLVHWIEHDALLLDNPYVRFVRGVSARGAYDPGLRRQLEDGRQALERLEPRLRCFLEVLEDRGCREPLVLYNPVGLASLRALGYRPSDLNLDHHLTLSNGRDYRIQCVDGNHRLAALWLCGAGQAPVLPVWTNLYGEDPEVARIAGLGASPDSVMEQLVTRAVTELSGQRAHAAAPICPDTGPMPVQRPPRG